MHGATYLRRSRVVLCQNDRSLTHEDVGLAADCPEIQGLVGVLTDVRANGSSEVLAHYPVRRGASWDCLSASHAGEEERESILRLFSLSRLLIVPGHTSKTGE